MKDKKINIKAIIIIIMVVAVIGFGAFAFLITYEGEPTKQLEFDGITYTVQNGLIDYKVANVTGTSNEDYTIIVFEPDADSENDWAEVLYKGNSDDVKSGNQQIIMGFNLDNKGRTKFYNADNELVMIRDVTELYTADKKLLGSFDIDSEGQVTCTDAEGNSISYSEMGELLGNETDSCIKEYWNFYGQAFGLT